MRVKVLVVSALAAVLLAAGCTNPPKLGLPAPASPPYSGYTDWGLVGADPGNTWAFVYGCTSTETILWASVDPGPQEPGTSVSQMAVRVFHGYVPGLPGLSDLSPFGSVEFWWSGGESDVAVLPAGECFTVVVSASSAAEGIAAGLGSFVLNW